MSSSTEADNLPTEANVGSMKMASLSLSYSPNGSDESNKLNFSEGLEEEASIAVSTALPCYRQTKYTSTDKFVERMIGPADLKEVACPCCHQALNAKHSQTMNEPPSVAKHRGTSTSLYSPRDNLSHCRSHSDEDLLPGILREGVKYCKLRVLAEGWLHKKGTGNDWLGSRAWKARYARLLLARVDDIDYDVPFMALYWHHSSLSPSTTLVLDSTVVLAVDLDNKELWNSFRFEIRHVAKRDNSTVRATRTFTAPKKERDAWVYEISKVLLALEKDKDQARKAVKSRTFETRGQSAIRMPPSPDRPVSPIFEDIWKGDRFVSYDEINPMSPPRSPSPRARSPVSSTSPPQSFTGSRKLSVQQPRTKPRATIK